MRKLTTLHYTIFVIAALAVLVAVPSAYAATVDVNPGCADADPNTPACDDGTTYPTIGSAVTAANATDTISISNATNHQEDFIIVSKPLTIEPAANERVILNGTTRIAVLTGNVTIQGITFQNLTEAGIAIGAPDVTIHNNTFADTRSFGISITALPDTPIRGLSITDNVLKNIGTFYDPGLNADSKAKILRNAIHVASELDNVIIQDSKITGNTIDTTSHGGIYLKNTENTLVQNNTISSVPANGIQVASGNNQIKILDNHIDDANNALQYLNGVPEDTTEGAILVWADDGLTHFTVANNTISGGNNGIVYCTGVCSVSANSLGAATPGTIIDPKTKIAHTNLFAHNAFDNVNGFDIMNMAAGVMIATHNYYGEAKPDFTAILFGNIRYNPYYGDPEFKVLVDDGTGTVQKATADLDVSDVCSISLGSYVIDFADAKYGATSGIVENQIKNAGNQDLGEIKFTSTGWLKPDGTALSGAVSRVGTDVGNATSYTPITTAPAGVNFDDADFIGSNALPVPGSPDPARVGFVLDLTRVATGAGVTVTESVTYSATCS